MDEDKKKLVRIADNENDETHKYVKKKITQKYDLKVLNRILELESWLTDKIEELYETERNPPPELDNDDLLKLEEAEIKNILLKVVPEAVSKQRRDAFVESYLEKAKEIKMLIEKSKKE